jgi:DNA polymerase-3 subunit alpha
VFEQIVERTLARRRERDAGILSLFGDTDAGVSFDDARIPIPDLEYDKPQRLNLEKEMLGLYVSDHPLLGVEAALRRLAGSTIAELQEARDGEVRQIGGVVTSLVRKYTKRGELMATFVLEDLQSSVDAMVFPKTMTEHGWKLEDDAIVVVRARLDTREDEPKIIVLEIERAELRTEGTLPLRLALPLARLDDGTVEKLKEILLAHSGPSPVQLRLGDKVVRLPEAFSVDTGNGLFAELRLLLGPDCIETRVEAV